MSRPDSRGRPWRRPPRVRSAWARWSIRAGLLGYAAIGLATLRVDVDRLREGLERGAGFLAGFLRPDFGSRWTDVAQGLAESLAMTVVATAAGIVVSIPVALAAARNLSPLPFYLAGRAVVTVARGFQEVLVAIFFVVLVGFGPLAGVLTLVVASVGFLAKLLAEAIEAVDREPVEAIRATGASWGQVLLFGIVPQVRPRFVGLAIYRLDINFRESAVVGVVGAGGIGATLNTAFDRYEFDVAAAILLLIIGIVLVGEIASGRFRRGMV